MFAITRRSVIALGLLPLAAPVIIRTPGLLMPIRHNNALPIARARDLARAIQAFSAERLAEAIINVQPMDGRPLLELMAMLRPTAAFPNGRVLRFVSSCAASRRHASL